MRIPVLLDLLNLKGSTTRDFLVLMVGAIFLLSASVVYPLGWLVRRLRRNDARQPSLQPVAVPEQTAVKQAQNRGLTTIAQVMAVVAAPVLFVFLIGLIAVVVEMILRNDARIFLGVAGSMRGWFLLALLFALLSLGMLVASIRLWAKRAWGVAPRLYYSLLTFSALLCSVILAKWDLISALWS